MDKDIKTLFAKGKSVFDAATGLKWRRNALPATRFAIAVGTKVAKSAVKRNRIRRRIRAVLQEKLGEFEGGYDVMVLVRPEAVRLDQAGIRTHLLSALAKTPILKKA